MASLAQRLADLAARNGQEFKSIRAAMNPRISRVVSLSNGGQGSNTSPLENMSQIGVRLPVRPTVKTGRWRMKFRLYHTGLDSGTLQTMPAVTMTGVSIAPAMYNSLTGELTSQPLNGTFIPIVSTPFALPVDRSFYVTPWQTDPLDADEYIVAAGWKSNSGSSVGVYGGTGLNFRFTTPELALAAGTAASTTMGAGVPFDMVLEYEVSSAKPLGLFWGDSLTEGVGGGAYSGTPSAGGGGTPWHHSWPQIWARNNNGLALNMALSSTVASQYSNGWDRESRIDIAAAKPDFGVLAFGANSSSALATYQSEYAATLARIRTYLPAHAPVFLATVPPRNAANSTHKSYSDWYRKLPFGVNGVLDFRHVLAAATEGIADSSRGYLYSDNLHLTNIGILKQAEHAGSILPSTRLPIIGQ